MKVYYAYGSDVESHVTFGIFSTLEKAQNDLMERATKEVNNMCNNLWSWLTWTYLVEEWDVDGNTENWWRIEFDQDKKKLFWFQGTR